MTKVASMFSAIKNLNKSRETHEDKVRDICALYQSLIKVQFTMIPL